MSTKPSSSFIDDTAVLKRLYAALNRGDIPDVLKLFDPEIERIEAPGFPTPGTYRGLAELEAHFNKGRSTWAEGACEPEQFTSAGPRIIVQVHVKVRLKDHQEWIDGQVTDVFTLKNGKVTEMHSFLTRDDALDWTSS